MTKSTVLLEMFPVQLQFRYILLAIKQFPLRDLLNHNTIRYPGVNVGKNRIFFTFHFYSILYQRPNIYNNLISLTECNCIYQDMCAKGSLVPLNKEADRSLLLTPLVWFLAFVGQLCNLYVTQAQRVCQVGHLLILT